jgi:hypothetical protein
MAEKKEPVKTDTFRSSDAPAPTYSSIRVRFGLAITLIGFVVFLIGARPGIFGLDRSPVIGFVQIAMFLVGLAVMCIGGYISLIGLWRGRQSSLAMEVGFRLVSTGYVITVFSGMADVFGFGSHPLPGVPYFGLWQAGGVMIGEGIIAIGFLMLVPYPKPKNK